MKKLLSLLLIFALTASLFMSPALAEGQLIRNEDGSALDAAQSFLENYLTQVNTVLADNGAEEINTLYECRKTFAVVGISENGGLIPDEMSGQLPCEITFRLEDGGIASAEIHSMNITSFSALCAALISSASDVSFDEAQSAAEKYAAQAQKEPGNSFFDEPDMTRGDSLRCYYSYFPDQYMDGTNWIQLTMVFPLNGYSGVMLTSPPSSQVRYQGDADESYEGYSYDGSEFHYEIFTSPTPEPEIDFSKK